MNLAGNRRAAVIGGGPAGLMAAETLAGAGLAVTVYDRMPTVGRKMLMAGRGGLNLTHAEPLSAFLARYGDAAVHLGPIIQAFPPEALTAWCEGLGQATFVGSSLRVFPVAMKASPLLRAWLQRLREQGVTIRTRQNWSGWDARGSLVFGSEVDCPAVTVLALGGASWPRLGSDGGWVPFLPGLVRPFVPANCGFVVAWSAHMRSHFAGQPLKRIVVRHGERSAQGDAIITEAGIEGTPIYALSGALREAIAASGPVTVRLDLRPDLSREHLSSRLADHRGLSLSNRLKRRAGLSMAASGLVQEALKAPTPGSAAGTGDLAGLIKDYPLVLQRPTGLERAISSAGGLLFKALDERLMLRSRPGVFVAGEMLDWEAPTGGYLLQACFSTGVAAARGALAWLASQS